MGCVMAVLACLAVLLCVFTPATHALGFNCSSPPVNTCQALVGYISPNATTLKSIQSLFGIKHLSSLLAANNLSPTLTEFSQFQSTRRIVSILLSNISGNTP
ncbi:hypothetical protein BT93_I1154 [Corymbia citriodora subsp. variegata]|nr:hypothetical protein BT93_I1154 [Corymbia citriodora subsp. variegata]